jgi:putative ABC transport system ATP-binding protein
MRRRAVQTRFGNYQRKFLTKFINLLAQVTPFLSYVGGYLVIVWRLDIGALVAVIAAYKDLPVRGVDRLGPERSIVNRVRRSSSSSRSKTSHRSMQRVIPTPITPSFNHQHSPPTSPADDRARCSVECRSSCLWISMRRSSVAFSGRSELAQLLTRLVIPNGALTVGGVDSSTCAEAVTGQVTGYAARRRPRCQCAKT